MHGSVRGSGCNALIYSTEGTAQELILRLLLNNGRKLKLDFVR
jgi:hypothetical protein